METASESPQTSQIILNPKWRPLFTSDSNYYLLTGGRGSGKSFALSYFALTLISLEAGHRIAVYRATMVSAKDSIMQDMKDLAEKLPNIADFEIKDREIINKDTGSSIFFKGIQTSRLDYTAALKGLSNCTTFILDEAEELRNKDLWQKIDDSFRTTNKQLRMIISLNPTTREHWIYNTFMLNNQWKEAEWSIPESTQEPVKCLSDGCGTKDNITYIHTTYLDNIDNLAPHKVRQWENYRDTDPDYYEHGVLGGWRARAKGVIFTDWEWMNPDWEWDTHRGMIYDINDPNQLTRVKWLGECGYGQDYGWYPDVTTLVRVGIDKKAGIIYLDECFYEQNLKTQHIIAKNLEHAGPNALIVADNSENRIISEVSAYCNIIACKKGPDSVTSGIQTMKNFKLVITPRSENLAKELQNYIWDEKKIDKHKESPEDKWNHAIDGIRYYVMHEILDGYSEDYSVY